MKIQSFFDEATNTFTYLVYDTETQACVLIDPILDYDFSSGTISESSAEKVLEEIQKKSLNLLYILETHIHADHLSGAQVFKKHFPKAQTVIHESVKTVQKSFSELFNFDGFDCSGSQFDKLVKDGDEIDLPFSKIKVLHTPGHTPACVCFHLENTLFTGDSIFMPDFGTGRCDFPGGSAKALYQSVKTKIYSLSDETKIFVGHDYGTGGREILNETTVSEQKNKNVHIKAQTSEEEFIQFREDRDGTLSPPKLLFQSLQVNIRGGRLPDVESNGMMYLKFPLKLKLK
ncbi:MAG: MBL fold metallo-hydrolase [Bacteriovoracaceae bacterium]